MKVANVKSQPLPMVRSGPAHPAGEAHKPLQVTPPGTTSSVAGAALTQKGLDSRSDLRYFL